MAQPLNESGAEVRIGRVTLRTPGLAGMVEVYEPAEGGTRGPTRSAEGATSDLLRALHNARTREQMTIEIAETRPVELGVDNARRGPSGEPSIEVDVPAAGDDWGQFVLATDEAGAVSWHLPVDQDNAVDASRGAASRTYVVPRRVVEAPAEGAAGARGVASAVGKKVLKVVVFPLVDPILGKVGEFFAHKWELRNRPYGLRSFTPGNYSQPLGEAIGEEAWEGLSAGPALLFVHGTFSRAYSAFGGLDPGVLEALHERYEGRVFAFDNPTLADTPVDNVDWLLQQLPASANLKLDVVCHSRGGLVSRELARRAGASGNGARVEIGRIVFVAVPNAGTVLTDSRHVGDFLDTYTNLLQFFPDNGVTDVLEAVIAVVKQLAAATLRGLDGLQSMLPGGPYLSALDVAIPAGAKYYALTSNFEPDAGSVGIRVVDGVVDRIFDGKQNDLVVPTEGVYRFGAELGGFGADPTPRLHVFTGDGAPVHTRFFAEPKTAEAILSWLR